MELCLDGSLLAVRSLVNHYLFDSTHLLQREAGTGRVVVHAAAMNVEHPDVLPYLVEQLKLFPAAQWQETLLDCRSQTPLHLAAAVGSTRISEYLAGKFPGFLGHQDINGNTPLMVALKQRRLSVVEVLLIQSTPGAVAANVFDRDGLTALHLACGLGLNTVATALITHHGADVLSSSTDNVRMREDEMETGGGADAPYNQVWDATQGDRNVTLVSDSAAPRLLEVAVRMQKASGGRRRQRAPRGGAATASHLEHSGCAFGGGTRGYTPLLCAIIHADAEFKSGAKRSSAAALIETIVGHGGLASADDARDLLLFLLVNDLSGLADRIVALDATDSARGSSGAVVHEARSDNALLCRLCERVCHSPNGGVQARSIEPLRWCLSRHCCAGVNEGDIRCLDGGVPLVTCARVGNVTAARFLIEEAGADPNAVPSTGAASPQQQQQQGQSSTPPVPPLLVAIDAGHAEVAGVLIRGGARVSAGGGSWSALAAAAVGGLEEVVRGLLGLDTLSPFDIPHALVEMLMVDAWSGEDRSGAHQNRKAIARRVRKAQHIRICEALARAVDPSACSVIHPVELLHLSASCGYLGVTRILCERLTALAPTVLAEVVHSAPEAPTERPTALIEPTMALVEDCPWKRLLPDPETGRGGLCRPPKPFYRLELANFRKAMLLRQPLHRVELRDAFSYAAAAGDGELVELLRVGVGLRPWAVPDMRGFTASDYAIRAANMELLCLFAAMGIAPMRHHQHMVRRTVVSLGGSTVNRNNNTVTVPPKKLTPLLRAIYHSQEHHGDASALVAAAMGSLVEEKSDRETVFDATQALRCLIEALCRQHGADNLRHAGAWMDPVVYACAIAQRLDVLEMLHDDYGYDFAHPFTLPTTPLLVAVARNDVPMMTFLLRVGCDVHEAAQPLPEMARYMKVKRAMDHKVTPLCLAAWMGQCETVRLLTCAAPLTQCDCTDSHDRLGDALFALVRGAPRGLAESDEKLISVAVRCLAAASHPFLSPLVLREAAAKQLVHTVEAIIDCYGPQTLLADITDPASLKQVNSLHYFAAHPAFAGMLRSMLVLTEADEYGVAVHKPTPLSLALLKYYGSGQDDKASKEVGEEGEDEDGRGVMCPVDWALSRGCREGSLALLAVGLVGTGTVQCVGRPSTWATRVMSVLQHYHRVRRAYRDGTFTVLHSAVQLGHCDVLQALTSEMKALRPVSDVVLAAGVRLASTAAGASEDGKRPAPSLHALATRSTAVWRRCVSSIEDVVRGPVPVRAHDMLTIVFSGIGVTRAVDAVLRMPCNEKLYASTFVLQDPDLDTAFLSEQIRTRPSCFLVDGGRAMLTGFTPLTCAIAAGSLEWVQYFVSVNPGAISYHRATATRVLSTQERRKEFSSRPVRRHRMRDPRKKPQRKAHHCNLDTQHALSLTLAQESSAMDALVLSMALLADATAAKDVGRMTTHTHIFEFLLRVPGSVRKSNVNAVAIAAAVLRRWDLLGTIMDQAAHLRDMPAGDRFLFTLLPEEIPLTLRRTIGAARHVMHVVAREGAKDMIVRVARHSTRSDIEGACDGDGHSCVFHALHHRTAPAATLDTFAALRIPLGPVCCRKHERTPLMVAALRGQTDVVAMLIKPERLNQRDRHGNTALILAASHGHLATVELLLASNAEAKLQNHAGMTAAMVAARAGHDHVSAPLAQNFSRVKDLGSQQTSLLHCAAVGGAWRTAEIVCRMVSDDPHRGTRVGIMNEDSDGHTALYLAHRFGHARVLRTVVAACYSAREMVPSDGFAGKGVDSRTRMLISSSNGATDEGGLRPSVTIGDTERRILRSDASLPCYGWLRELLPLNDVVVREAAKAAATVEVAGSEEDGAPLRPGERRISPQLPTFRARYNEESGESTAAANQGALLKWCAIVNNAVGVRVLADLNIADTCGALHLAARFGHLDTVKLLVSLEMSDAGVADEDTGLFPFETAAVAGHRECAEFLLAHTSADVIAAAALSAVPLPSVVDGGGFGGEETTTRYPHGLLHRVAPVCGGAVLVLAIDRMLSSTTQVAALSERLWSLLQQPDEAGLTPFEYTIAMGDPCAVLRCAQVLQQLAQEAAHPKGIAGPMMDGITIAGALLDYIPNLSPAVRALLFDVFSVERVSRTVGFDPDPSEAKGGRSSSSSPTAAITAGGGGGEGEEDQGASGNVVNSSGAIPQAAAPLAPAGGAKVTHRLSFADVRLLGINALYRDAYCQPLVNTVYTIDHERLALRYLMRSFPYRIRYEPEAFRSRTLAQQKKLLQWLSTSLILSTYDGAQPGDIDTIEVRIASHRGDELYLVNGAESSSLSHAIYVSSGNYIVAPDVHATFISVRAAYRAEVERELGRLCRRATKAMRKLPHPSLQAGNVVLDWNLSSITTSAAASPGADVHGDRERWDSVVRRVRAALEGIVYKMETTIAGVLASVKADDLLTVVNEVKKPQPATIVLRYVAEGPEAVLRFPPLSELTGKSGDTAGDMCCTLAFDRQSMTDAGYAMENTIQQAVEADVALVRVHYVRDRFLRRLREALRRPIAREEARAAERLARQSGVITDGTESQSTALVVVPAGSEEASPPSTAAAAGVSSVKFKLELESADLAAIPMGQMWTMLENTADVVERVLAAATDGDKVSGNKNATATSPKAVSASQFHSTSIIAEALGRRLRTVLVLFSTKREPLVKFSGDKLMLCFTSGLAPSASEILGEIKKSIITEEITVCRRLLANIVDVLSERLRSYLPSVRLVIDTAAIDDPNDDRENVLSALRVLTYQHSALVLEPFVSGASLGWTARWGRASAVACASLP